MGKLGEIAFSKFLLVNGKQVTRADNSNHIECTDEMFNGWKDFLLSDYCDVDTVATSHPNNSAILVQKNRHDCDYYVGLRPLDDSYKLWQVVGYCTHEEMGEHLPQVQRDGSLAYRRRLALLRPIDELLERFAEA